MSKRKAKHFLKIFYYLAVILIAILTIFCCLVLFGSSKTTFNIVAETEQIQFNTQYEMDSNWILENVTIREDIFSDSSDYRFSGSIKIPLNTTVKIDRISFGPLKLSFEKSNEDFSGVLFDYDGEYKTTLTSSFEIYIDSIASRADIGESIIFPLNGLKGMFGTSEPLSNEVESIIPILRSGKVKLLNKSIFNSGLSETGNFDLQLGDQFVINEPQNKGFGFIVANEEPNLMISYSVIGNSGEINKLGGNQRNISSSVFSKIINDKFLSIVSILLAAIIALITLLTFWIDYSLFVHSLKKK